MNSEYISPDDKAVVKVDKDSIPEEVPILALENQMAFPTLNMSLEAPTHASALIEAVMKGNHLVGIVGTKMQADDVLLPGQMSGKRKVSQSYWQLCHRCN